VDPSLRPQSRTDQFPHGCGRFPAFNFEYHSKSGELVGQGQLWLVDLSIPQHIVVDIKRIYSGLVLYRDTLGGPPAWFANEREPSFIFKNMAYAIQTALGDGVVVRILLLFGTLSPFSLSDISKLHGLALSVGYYSPFHFVARRLW
jgi:hypothetical protein